MRGEAALTGDERERQETEGVNSVEISDIMQTEIYPQIHSSSKDHHE